MKTLFSLPDLSYFLSPFLNTNGKEINHPLIISVFLFIALIFIARFTVYKDKSPLVVTKTNKNVDPDDTLFTFVGAILFASVIVYSALFLIDKSIELDMSSGSSFINFLMHAAAIMVSLVISFAISFLVAFLIYASLVIPIIYLSTWQECSKRTRPDNNFMLANLSLVAAITFSLVLCLSLFDIKYLPALLVVTAIPAIFFYCQEAFYFLRSFRKKT